MNVALTASHEISCVSSANPIANVSWFRFDKNNRTVYMYSRMKVEQLTFGAVKTEDGGLYMCTATSRLGSVTKYVHVVVKGKRK